MKLLIPKILILVTVISLIPTFNFAVVVPEAQAAINLQINYQGKLTNTSDVAVANGDYNMEFILYDALSGGTILWTETRTGANKVTVTNGLFSVMLGSVTSLASVDFNQTVYLGVNIGGTGTPSWDGEMTPRKIIGAVPAAFLANGVNGTGGVRSTLSSTTALAIAKAGTDYALQVDTSTASAVTGLKVTSAAAAGGLALSTLSTGANENLSIDAKGSGTISLGATSTGSTLFGGGYGSTGVSISAAGNISTNGTLLTDTSVSTPSIITASGALGITPASGSNLNVTLATTGDFAVNTNQLYVDTSTTRVGIGTASPSGKLHIYSAGGLNSGINLEATSSAAYAVIDFNTNAGLAGQFLATGSSFSNGIFTGDQLALANYLTNGSTTLVAGGSNGFINFATGGYLTGNERMRIDSTGRVGIMNTSPSALLTLGTAGTTAGTLSLAGSTSGTITIQPQAAAGTYNFNLPTTAGTSGYILTSAGGGASPMTWTDPSGLGVRWNSIVAPTGNASIAMGAYTTDLTFNSATTGNIFGLSSSSLTTGNLVNLASTSTAAGSNTQTVLNVATSGANGTSTQTTYGAQFANTHTGTSSTNIAAYFTASGGTNNYAAIFNAGNVGIGTTAPSSSLHVVKADNGTDDILKVLANNLTQGIGISYNTITAIGSNTDQNIIITPKGAGDIITTAGTLGVGYTPTTGTAVLMVNGGAAIGDGTTLDATIPTNGLLVKGSTSIGSTTATSMFNVGTAAQFQVNSSGAIAAATGITSSGTIAFSGLSSNGAVYTSGGTGTLTTTAPTSGTLGYWSRSGTTISPATSGDVLSVPGVGTNSEKFGAGSSAAGNYSAVFGNGASSAGTHSVSIGTNASTGYIASVSLGYGANIINVAGYNTGYGVAIGYNASADSFNTSVGANSVAGGYNNVAIGAQSSAAGIYHSTAVGYGSAANLNDGTALGFGSDAVGAASVSLGSGTRGSGYSVAIGLDANAGNTTSNLMNIAIGASTSINSSYSGTIVLGTQAVATASAQFIAGSSGYPIDNVYFGKGAVNATPTAYTINGTGGSGTDIAGGALNIAGGKGTGNAAGGDVVFQTSTAGASGTTLQSLATKMIIQGSTGNVGIGDTTPAALFTVGSGDLFQVASNGNLTSSNAGTWTFSNDTNFALTGGVNGLSIDGTTFSVDGTNNRIGLGIASPSYQLDIRGSVENNAVFVDTSSAQTTLSILGGDTNGYYPTLQLCPLADCSGTSGGGSIQGYDGLSLVPRSSSGYVRIMSNDSTYTNTVKTMLSIEQNTTATPANGLGSALLYRLESSTTNYQDAASISAYWTDVIHATRTANLGFSTVNSGSLSEKLTIQGNGNVGIGTTGPDRKLDVLDTSNPQIRLTTTDGTVYSDLQNSANINLAMSGSTLAASSGLQYGMQINPTVNQSSTAGYTGLLVNITDTATGSGTKSLLDLQRSNVSYFRVAPRGAIISELYNLGYGSEIPSGSCSGGSGLCLVDKSGAGLQFYGDQMMFRLQNSSNGAVVYNDGAGEYRLVLGAQNGMLEAGIKGINNTMLKLQGNTTDSGSAEGVRVQWNANVASPTSGAKIVTFGYVDNAPSYVEKAYIDKDGTIQADSLTSGGTQCLQASSSGVISGTGLACGSGGGLTVGSTAISSGTAGRILFEGSGNVLQEAAGLAWDNTDASLVLSTSSTTVSNKALNVSQTGGTTGTDYAGYFSNTGSATTNIAGYFTASGATNNYAAIFDAGNVGIGTTTPTNLSGTYFGTNQVNPLWVSANDGSKVTSLVVQGNLGEAIQFVDQTGAAEADFGVYTTDLYFVNRQASGGIRFVNATSTAMYIDPNSNVGIGTGVTSLPSLLSVGTSSVFQVNSSGAIAAATGILSSGTIRFSSLTSNGPLYTSAGDGTLTTTAPTSGAIGYWSRSSTTISPTTANDIILQATANTTGADLGITNTGVYTGTGIFNLTANSATTGTLASITGNGLTSGTALSVSSSGLTSGSLVNLASTSTGAASNTQTVLNVATSGANGTSSQTTYGAKFANTHTGSNGTNIAAYFTASGGTFNYPAIFNVDGIGAPPSSSATDIGSVKLVNNTAAANGSQQASPALLFEGRGWKTTGGSSQSNYLRMFNLPVQGSQSAPSLVLQRFEPVLQEWNDMVTFYNSTISASTLGLTTTGGGNLNLSTSVNGNITLAPNSTGSVQITSAGVTTGTGTSSATSLVANALTSGTGLYIASSSASQTTSKLIDIAQTGVTTGYTGNLINLSSSSTTGAATFINLAANSSTVGVGQAISMTALTTGTGLSITGGSALTTNGELLDLNMGAATAGNGINIATTGVYTGTGLAVITANSATSGTIQGISATGLTTGYAQSMTLGSALTTGGALSITGASYNHTASETGSLFSMAFTEATTTSSFYTTKTNGIFIVPTIAGSGNALKVISGVNVDPTYTSCSISGGGQCYYSGITSDTPNVTNSNTSTVNISGITIDQINGAANLTQNTAAGAINWKGLDIKMPNVTQTTGSINAYGAYIVTGYNYTSANQYGVRIVPSSGMIAGTLTGISVDNITAGAGTETAISVGTGWDTGISNGSNYVQSAGTMSLTSANTTQVTTASAFALNANSLTTGTGLYAASSTLTSGKLIDLQVSGTAAAASQTALNILTTGANATSGIATYAAKFSNTHTGTNAINVGVDVTVSGGAGNAVWGENITTTGNNAQTKGLEVSVNAGSGGSAYGTAGEFTATTAGSSAQATAGSFSATCSSGLSCAAYGATFSATGTTNTASTGATFSATGGTWNYSIITTAGNVGIGDASPASLLTVGNGDLFQVNSSGAIVASAGYIQGSGTMSLTSANTTQVTTASAFALNANSLTTGTGLYAASSTLTSGKLIDLQVSGTAAAASQTALNILTTGANGTAGITTYGAQISNTHSTNTSTNVGLLLNATGGATANYALVTTGGNVGIGTTAPGALFTVEDGASADAIRIGDTSAGYYYKLGRNTTTGYFEFDGTQSGYRGYIFNNSGNAAFNNADSFTVSSNGSANMRITSTAAGASSIAGLALTNSTQAYSWYLDNRGSGGSDHFGIANNAGTEMFAISTGGNITLSGGATSATTTLDLGGTGTSNAVCHTTQTGTNDEGLVDCTSAPAADFAEMYPVTPDAEVGDVVVTGAELINTYETSGNVINWNKVKGQVTKLTKSTTSYAQNVVGIVSDNYGDFISTGYNIKPQDNPKSIALVGRVPVKVSTENGEIKAGDFLTSSATLPGYAMKATTAGPVIGMALADFNSASTGKVMVFVKATTYNGARIESQLAGLSFDYTAIVSTVSESSEQILTKLISQIANLHNDNLSQLNTDLVIANAEVISPNVTTGGLRANTLASAASDGGIEVESATIFKGGLKVDNIGSLGSLLTFLGDVEFIGTPYLNKDTAGFAVVSPGATSVDITFTNSYAVQPIVGVTISFEQNEDLNIISDSALQEVLKQQAIAEAQSFFTEGVSYVVTNKSSRGFTIVLSKPSTKALKFSWTAFAVKNANVFTSIENSPTPSNSDILNNEGTVSGDSTVPLEGEPVPEPVVAPTPEAAPPAPVPQPEVTAQAQ